MRIIAGNLKGRVFDSPHTDRTHPMSDKVKGALFNILGDISGLTVLDAFAGSGALSFEAVSRDAQEVVAIELDKGAQEAIVRNIESLNVGDKVKLIRSSVNAWLQTNPGRTFDIVLADPPYDDLQPATLHSLARHTEPNGLLVLSWPTNTANPSFEELDLIDNRNYGDANLVFYRRIQ